MSEKIPLDELLAGQLFRYNGSTALKSEYRTDAGACECYLLGSGEMFWGGTNTAEELNALMVEPITESEPPAPAGEESMSDFLNSKGEDDYELYEEDAKNDTKIIEAVREENSAL
jgi:hypothetical protein